MKARAASWPSVIFIVPCLFALVFLAEDGCIRPHSSLGFVTLEVSIEGNGRVEGIPADTVQRAGTRLTLTAAPDSGYFFVGWQGPSFSNANPLTITIEQNLLLVACFAKPPAGLVPIHANGSSFAMGSSDALAMTDPYEQPVHTVHFMHDFYLSPCLIMQKEYATLMGVNPSSVAPAGVGDSFPVFNVTWYQAALYCNRRSRMENYDTVYSYSAVCTSSICTVVLENLTINYNRFGYRLPTEAEWEYACRAGTTTDFYWGETQAESTAVKYAWSLANSPNQVQKVGRLLPNGYGLYDMVGNVSQWVNDWCDYYPDTAVTDPIGPSQLSQENYEASGEPRPRRGGSYQLNIPYLRSSCRVGSYGPIIPPNDPGLDVGFRVAIGAFKPGAAQPKTATVETFNTEIICDLTNLTEFVNASNIKIAFVVGAPGHSRLVFLDFLQPDLHFQQCGRDSSVFGTSITPDGNFIAYSSNGEGSSSPCTTTVRHLDSLGSSPVRIAGAYLPHFWASPSSAETTMIYSDGASDNSQPEWYTERTYSRQFQRGNLGATPLLMTPLGSYHGGLSSDGRFLGTGYKIGRAVDLQLNSTLYDTNNFYFGYPFNGHTYPDTGLQQLCNLQMSPSIVDPGEALFLDFGDPTVNTLVGKSYGLHQILWVCDLRLATSQQVEQWFECPSGSWNYPRWSNNSHFAIAIVQPSSGNIDTVHLIRRSDGAYLQVATGQNLSYPALWIDPSQVLENGTDSFPWFGEYDVPVMDEGNIVFGQKLRLYWHFRQAPSVIAIGSSPVAFGFNTLGMSERTLNVASMGNADAVTSAILTEKYLLPFTPGLKVILLDLFPGLLNEPGITYFPELDGVAQSKGWECDSENNFYRGGLPSQIITKAGAFTQSIDWPTVDSSGNLLGPSVGTGWGQPLIDPGHGDFSIDTLPVQTSLSYIAALGDSVAAHGVHLILVYMPENPLYDTTGMIGVFGPSITTYQKIAAWVDSLTQQNSYVHFWDANNYGHHDFVDSEALDCSHLNYKGGMRIAAKLDSLIRLWVH
jgi:formylglycine-generating enzyme required for sulfatase activity